jgi:cytochrome d ubiquinol oxidase subunit I
VKFAIEIPKLSSLILKHSLDAPLAGLDTVPRENWPPVAIVFWSFRVMVGLGFLMMGLGLLSLLMRVRGKLYDSRLLHIGAVAMGPAGFVAVLAGWITTEVGRQPWIVYQNMRVSEAVTDTRASSLWTMLGIVVVVYAAAFGTFLAVVLKMRTRWRTADELPEGDTPYGPRVVAGSTKGSAR